MDIKKIILSGAFISATLIPTAYAADNYFGGGLALIEYSETGLSDDANLTAIFGKFGSQFNENFAGEVRIGLGLGDDSIDVFGTSATLELNNFYGAYLKAGIPASEKFYPYAVIGYTRGELEASAFGSSISESESDVSFGLGADFSINETTDISIEYMNYLDKDGVELSGFSLSLSKAL